MESDSKKHPSYGSLQVGIPKTLGPPVQRLEINKSTIFSVVYFSRGGRNLEPVYSTAFPTELAPASSLRGASPPEAKTLPAFEPG